MARPAGPAKRLGWAAQQRCREVLLESRLLKFLCLVLHSVTTSHQSSHCSNRKGFLRKS